MDIKGSVNMREKTLVICQQFAVFYEPPNVFHHAVVELMVKYLYQLDDIATHHHSAFITISNLITLSVITYLVLVNS